MKLTLKGVMVVLVAVALAVVHFYVGLIAGLMVGLAVLASKKPRWIKNVGVAFMVRVNTAFKRPLIVLVAVVLAGVHLYATMFSGLMFGLGVLSSNNSPWIGNAGVAFAVLGFPVNLLGALPLGIEGGLYAANSLLWGACVATLTAWLARRIKKAASPTGRVVDSVTRATRL